MNFTENSHIDLRYRYFLLQTILKNIPLFAESFFADSKTKQFAPVKVC